MTLPNFFVAGAPTSGTTALYSCLRQHPQVFMSPIKEPTFFAAADLLSQADQVRAIHRDAGGLRAYLDGPRVAPARFWVTEWDDYQALFRDVDGQTAVGEASASYFWLPSAAPALRAALPGARLVFLLRHPADRLFSWYARTLQREPGLSFRGWFLQARVGGGNGWPTTGHAALPLDGGYHAPHFRRFFQHFSRKQVRVYLHESFRADPQGVVRDIFTFLGVDPGQPIDVSRRLNETLVPRFPVLHRLRRRVIGNASLTAWLPPRAGAPLRRLYQRSRRDLQMDPGDRRLVIDCYRDDILQTADLVGHDLTSWLH